MLLADPQVARSPDTDPASHCTHELPDWYVPALQVMHESAVGAEIVPAGQFKQAVVPSEYVPAAHMAVQEE